MFSMFGRTGPPQKGAPQILHKAISRRLSGYFGFKLRVLYKMSMMTTLSLCVSCEFSRTICILGGGTFFLNRALLRLNPVLFKSGNFFVGGRSAEHAEHA